MNYSKVDFCLSSKHLLCIKGMAAKQMLRCCANNHWLWPLLIFTLLIRAVFALSCWYLHISHLSTFIFSANKLTIVDFHSPDIFCICFLSLMATKFSFTFRQSAIASYIVQCIHISSVFVLLECVGHLYLLITVLESCRTIGSLCVFVSSLLHILTIFLKNTTCQDCCV